MQWTDIEITVPQAYAGTAEAIATMVANGGIYIEDYSDLEQQAWEIAHVDLIEQELLDKPRDVVKVHMYLAPDENPAEVLPLFKERLEASGIPYELATNGVEQEDWQNAWKKKAFMRLSRRTKAPWAARLRPISARNFPARLPALKPFYLREN